MATIEQLSAALVKADAAGNTDDAKVFADALRALKAQGGQSSVVQLQGKVADLPSRQPPKPDLLSSTLATVNGISASVPFLQNTTDAIGGTIAQLTGGKYDDYVSHQRAVREGLAKQAPLARLSGEIGGLVGGTGVLGATKLGAEALGLTGNLGQRVLNSGLSSAGLSTADALSRGEKGTDALISGGVGGAIGGLLPIGGAIARATGRGIANNFIKPIATMANKENAVTKTLGGAIGLDRASGAVMDAGTQAVAQKAGAEVLNADRFGSAIRTLARTASNVSPEADNAFKSITDQRFVTQGKRAVDFVRSLMGGATDDLALQEQLRTAAKATNKTAYDAAYAAPKAKAIWTPEIRNLLTAGPFKKAVQTAEETAANEAAISGGKAIRNPFMFDEAGNVTGLRPMPGGGVALPNLEFWDIVQRNLRRQADMAANGGDKLLAGQIGDMRKQLLSSLDGAVPQFKKARQGAAGFFGAEDAIEAGRKAFGSTKATNEIGRAVMAMSPAEKDAFSVGFSSEIIDAINASRDRVNVINSIFGSESARQRIAIALGPQRARELEAYVKMEQVLDLLRNATQGNSTTAKQLIAAGLLGTGTALYTGDASTGFNVATLAYLGRRGLQMMGKKVDDQVMKRVAEILASPDPALLQRAIQNASLSQQHMVALDGLMRGLAITSRGVALGAAN